MTSEPNTAAGPPAAESLDWSGAARLLADGGEPATVNARLGLAPGELDRRIRDDPLVRGLLEACRGRVARAAAEPAVSLRQRVLGALERELAKGNPRVMLWLADRLAIVTPETDRSRRDAVVDAVRAMTPEERAEYEALAER